MELPWILAFISIILIAIIAWHSSRFSLIDTLKSKLQHRRRTEHLVEPYHDEVYQDDLFGQPQDSFVVEEIPSVPKAAPHSLILAIHLKAPAGRYFGGEQLVIQLNRAGLRFGDFNIFHYNNLFSLASAYEPGTFDLDRIEQLRTGALTFFMETAHLKDIREGFETMLDTAQHLADQLRAELFDEKWQPLNEITLESYFRRIDDASEAQDAVQ